MDTDDPPIEEPTAFSTSGDTPLDGPPQKVAPLAEPVPGTVLDDPADRDQAPR
ncbi:MAG: hypothetical protein ACR2N4_18535 [Jatrophihabitans sp.]